MISEPWPVDNIAEHKLRININTKMIVHSRQKGKFHWARAVCYHSTHTQMMSSESMMYLNKIFPGIFSTFI